MTEADATAPQLGIVPTWRPVITETRARPNCQVAVVFIRTPVCFFRDWTRLGRTPKTFASSRLCLLSYRKFGPSPMPEVLPAQC